MSSHLQWRNNMVPYHTVCAVSFVVCGRRTLVTPFPQPTEVIYFSFPFRKDAATVDTKTHTFLHTYLKQRGIVKRKSRCGKLTKMTRKDFRSFLKRLSNVVWNWKKNELPQADKTQTKPSPRGRTRLLMWTPLVWPIRRKTKLFHSCHVSNTVSHSCR
jgi:hypothetical protein